MQIKIDKNMQRSENKVNKVGANARNMNPWTRKCRIKKDTNAMWIRNAQES